jgi:hypothetical protein
MELSMMADAGSPRSRSSAPRRRTRRAASVSTSWALSRGQVGRLHRPQRDPLADIARMRSIDSVWISGTASSGRERVAGLYLSRAAFLFQLMRPERDVAPRGGRPSDRRRYKSVGAVLPPTAARSRAPPGSAALSPAVLQGLLDDGAAVGHRWSMAGIERSRVTVSRKRSDSR